MLLGIASILSLFILPIFSQLNLSNQCFPLNSRRFLSCPPGYGQRSLSQSPPPINILERRLFIRNLRNPSTPKLLCCREGNSVTDVQEDSEKLSSPQIQFPDNIRKRRPNSQNPGTQGQPEDGRRKRRRGRRKKPRSRFHAIINKLGESVDEFLNTSLTYTQYDGWTWTFRPFKVFDPFGEEQVFEKYRTRRGRNFRRNNLTRAASSLPLQEPSLESTTTPPPKTSTSVPKNREFEENEKEASLPPFQKPLPQSSRLIEASQRSPPTLTSSPYLVSIRRNGVNFCSGIVLDSKHILTAANCFVSSIPGTASQEMVVNVDPNGVTVNVGTIEDGNASELLLDHICVHNTVPNPGKELNEVAILTLQKPLVFTGDFFPARILWEEKGDLLDGGNNYAIWFSTSGLMESSPIKQVASRVCKKRHRFFMRKDEFCLQLGRRQGKPCSKNDFLGGVLECSAGPSGRTQVCGVITETSCPPLQQPGGIQKLRKNPVTKVSPIPKWIYPILSSNSYRSCF